MISFLVCFGALYRDRERLAAPDHKPGPPGSRIFNSPGWALLRMAPRKRAFSTWSASFAHRPFQSQQKPVIKVAPTQREPKSLQVDFRTALAAFIVYLLLPEFWVGWKQA
jgi:hypothetical protein